MEKRERPEQALVCHGAFQEAHRKRQFLSRERALNLPGHDLSRRDEVEVVGLELVVLEVDAKYARTAGKPAYRIERTWRRS